MLHSVIMAGGAGTRFWPASRVDQPKQLLNLAGDRTMIQSTVDRLEGLVTRDRILIVTNERLVDAIRQQLPELPPDSVVGEPCKRDTAPCIGLAALLVSRNDDEATMAVMPADHLIQPPKKFCETISYAAELIEDNPDRIVTFGIRPTYPAESFGYIERGDSETSNEDQPQTFNVNRFREKPTKEVAQEYVGTGRFYWNSGIFLWKAQTILHLLEKFEPEMYGHLKRIGDAMTSDDYWDVLQSEFEAIKGKSIDYAVMEHHDDVVVVEAPFDWDDVGSWPALSRMREPDSDGNTVTGKHLGINTRNTIVRGNDEHLIVTLGMDECIVVHTPDATLVAHKNDEESVRKIVDMLKKKGWDQYL